MLVNSLFMGIVATIVIDLWALALKFGFGIQKTDWGMVGRWFGHIYMSRVVVHQSIADAASVTGERGIGWIAHYAIGVFYAWAYLYIVQVFLAGRPTLVSAIAFGLVTLVAPWFILQPGMGLGIFARRAPNPWIPRLTSLFAHSIFGASLYLGWRLAGHLLPA